MTIFLTVFTAESVTTEDSSDDDDSAPETFEERPPDQGEPANKAERCNSIHAIPFFIESNCLPLHSLFFQQY